MTHLPPLTQVRFVPERLALARDEEPLNAEVNPHGVVAGGGDGWHLERDGQEHSPVTDEYRRVARLAGGEKFLHLRVEDERDFHPFPCYLAGDDNPVGVNAGVKPLVKPQRQPVLLRDIGVAVLV